MAYPGCYFKSLPPCIIQEWIHVCACVCVCVCVRILSVCVLVCIKYNTPAVVLNSRKLLLCSHVWCIYTVLVNPTFTFVSNSQETRTVFVQSRVVRTNGPGQPYIFVCLKQPGNEKLFLCNHVWCVQTVLVSPTFLSVLRSGNILLFRLLWCVYTHSFCHSYV